MGNISGEWIIYGVEWDNPENGSLYLQTIAGTDMILMLCSTPYKHKKIMDFFMEEKYLKTVCFLPSGFSLL